VTKQPNKANPADLLHRRLICSDRLIQAKLNFPHQRMLQRKEELEEEVPLQTKAVLGQTPYVTPNLETCINVLWGGGQPLSESELAFFEPRFGYDFSQVRVYRNTQAAEAAQALNARAFTVGRDIAFGVGQYAPETDDGNYWRTN